MRADTNPIVFAGLILISALWNLKLHKPLEILFPPSYLMYGLGGAAIFLGIIFDKRPAVLSKISLFLILIPTTISWIISNRLGYQNTYFYELSYATMSALAVHYVGERHAAKLIKYLFYSIGIISILLFITPEYYNYFDKNAFERPTFSMVRAGGPMLSSNEMPLAMILLYLVLARMKRDNFSMIAILIVAVVISQSKAAAIGVLICLLSPSAVGAKSKFLIVLTIIFSGIIAFGEELNAVYDSSRFSLASEDSQESTKLRSEAIGRALSQMQLVPLTPQDFDYNYPVTPHVTVLSPIAKFGLFFGGFIAISLMIGILLVFKKHKALGLAFSLFTFTEPVLYIIPSAVLALTVVSAIAPHVIRKPHYSTCRGRCANSQ